MSHDKKSMRGRPRKPTPTREPTPAPNTATLRHDDLLTRAQAVALIAKFDERSKPGDRQSRNRANKRLAYATATGHLAFAQRGMVSVAALGDWMRGRGLPGGEQLPRRHGEVAGTMCAREQPDSAAAHGVVLPNDLSRCHRMIGEHAATIVRLNEQLAKLDEALRDAQLLIQELRPDAEKWRSLRQRNAESGRGKRGRSKRW